MVRSLEKGVQISHSVFYHAGYIGIFITGSSLLINKTEKATDTKDNQNFKKMKGRI